MKKLSPLMIILGLGAVLLLWVWSSYNGLITERELVNESWAQVETQYQRRFDLVPNLVETVKGAARFEQETFTEVTQARTQWQSAGTPDAKIAAAQGFESAFARLLVTFENYPQLKATEAYRDLLTQLEGTENRIATARRDFNEAARAYNVRVKRFPSNLLARLFGFEPRVFFEAAEGAETAPAIDF